MTDKRRALQLFVRNPVEGAVKTRLVATIGAAAATAVYRRLLTHALDTAAALPDTRVTAWVDRLPVEPTLRSQISARRCDTATQCTGDLGRRMRHALDAGLADAEHVVLIGSDCPGYSAAYLEQAFKALFDCDVVLGPATDGGYVLIGARCSCPEVFDAMPWGTSAVLDATRARLQALSLSYAELPTLRDLDDAADLRHFPDYLATAHRAEDNRSAAGSPARLE